MPNHKASRLPGTAAGSGARLDGGFSGGGGPGGTGGLSPRFAVSGGSSSFSGSSGSSGGLSSFSTSISTICPSLESPGSSVSSCGDGSWGSLGCLKAPSCDSSFTSWVETHVAWSDASPTRMKQNMTNMTSPDHSTIPQRPVLKNRASAATLKLGSGGSEASGGSGTSSAPCRCLLKVPTGSTWQGRDRVTAMMENGFITRTAWDPRTFACKSLEILDGQRGRLCESKLAALNHGSLDTLGCKSWNPQDCAIYPLVMTNIAIKNGDLSWVFPLNMVIFHSFLYVYQRVNPFKICTWFLGISPSNLSPGYTSTPSWCDRSISSAVGGRFFGKQSLVSHRHPDGTVQTCLFFSSYPLVI